MRVRTILVLTVIMACALGGTTWYLRMQRLSTQYLAQWAHHLDQSSLFKRQSSMHASWIAKVRESSGEAVERGESYEPASLRRRWLTHAATLAEVAAVDSDADALARRRAAYHAWLAEKYHQAAMRPWLPVAPDPPEPE